MTISSALIIIIRSSINCYNLKVYLKEITWSFLEESNCLKIFNFIGSLCKSKTVEFSQAEISFGHSPNIKFEMVAYNKRDKHIPFVEISQDTGLVSSFNP